MQLGGKISEGLCMSKIEVGLAGQHQHQEVNVLHQQQAEKPGFYDMSKLALLQRRYDLTERTSKK